jgi:ribosomal protein L11 methyltransferase
MSHDWIEVQIQSSFDAGELLGLLDDASVPGAWQEGRTIHLYWPSDTWSRDHLTRLRQALLCLTGQGVTEPDIVVQSLPHEDWNGQWARSVKPLRVGARIVIRPSWEPAATTADQIEIILDPKQAFGTGHHPTTRLLLEWLEEHIRGGERVFDVGTGSGLLAMVALRLGAATALAIDHDPEAIGCAKEYAAVNGFGPELALRCATLRADARYDVVLANLDRGTLLELAQPLAASTGGLLLVSGLLNDQRSEIVQAFAGAGMYSCREWEREGWLAMEFRPAESCDGAGA